MRAAVDTGVHVLLRGEPGVGRELLARSIHLSSPQRNGPFIVASAAGANPTQVEADLFGSEVAARTGPVKREGKIRLADGGTLFLDDVDRCRSSSRRGWCASCAPARWSRPAAARCTTSSVRLVAASRQPLEPAVARDEFRVDLAYRLSRFVIDVPPLRERKEDLPLLIQSFVNRFCHETGKRVAGITTKAMTALLSYPYPGNLEELENIARQMVYLTARTTGRRTSRCCPRRSRRARSRPAPASRRPPTWSSSAWWPGRSSPRSGRRCAAPGQQEPGRAAARDLPQHPGD